MSGFLIGAEQQQNTSTTTTTKRKLIKKRINKKKINKKTICSSVLMTDSGGFLIGDKILTPQQQLEQQRTRREERKLPRIHQQPIFINSPTKSVIYSPIDNEVDEFLIQPNQVNDAIHNNNNNNNNRVWIKQAIKSKHRDKLQQRKKQILKELQKRNNKQSRYARDTKILCSNLTPYFNKNTSFKRSIKYFNDFLIRPDQITTCKQQ